MRPERLAAILSEKIEGTDWTAVVLEDATLSDLDEAAIAIGREKFKEKHKNELWFDQIDRWDWSTFLDKAKVTANGKITRAALLIFGSGNSTFCLPTQPSLHGNWTRRKKHINTLVSHGF
jgi:ATP-dependent DNA helicase RecG